MITPTPEAAGPPPAPSAAGCPNDRIGLALRTVTTLGTVAIAVMAAVVSYRHIHDVVRAYGESPTAAVLVPLCVDGLVLVCSLTLLADQRDGRPRSTLATTGLALGALASLAANIAHAEPTAIGRLVAAWPSIAFAISHELLLDRMLPSTGTAPKDESRAQSGPIGAEARANQPPRRSSPRPGSKRAQLAAAVAGLDPADPRTTYQLARDLAPALGLHEGTARRYIASYRTQSGVGRGARPSGATG